MDSMDSCHREAQHRRFVKRAQYLNLLEALYKDAVGLDKVRELLPALVEDDLVKKVVWERQMRTCREQLRVLAGVSNDGGSAFEDNKDKQPVIKPRHRRAS